MLESAEFCAGIIAEEMIGRGPYSTKVDVVEPGPERIDARPEVASGNGAEARLNHVHLPIDSAWE